MGKNKIKNEAINLISKFGNKIPAKFNNVSGKTGQYYVPSELFQKRTSRSNRILLPWKTLLKNNFTLEQLKTCEGGVVVEFLNDDFFMPENEKNYTFRELKNLLGSNETVSSIISIHSEEGTSSSILQRNCFKKLLNDTEVKYNGETIKINKDNYKNYLLNQIDNGGKGNEKWNGFLYFSIKGGQQDSIESHKNKSLTLFNPACEYANSNVSMDITLVLLYFAYKSITNDDLSHYNIDINQFNNTFFNIKKVLRESYYNSDSYKGNLLDYCEKHISCQIDNNRLVDPIQLKPINISNFNIDRRTEYSIDLTHDEAVTKENYYWDSEQKCILSPARPTNLFWSYHLSNMMQQNYSLNEYFENEEKIYLHRKKIIKGLY